MVISFIQCSGEGGDGVKEVDGGSLFYPATSFTLLEYMIIMCNIQVIINPLPRITSYGRDCSPELFDLMYCPGPGPAIQED